MKRSENGSLSLLRRVAENPFLNIAVGFILMVTSLLECLEPFFGNMFHSPIGVHHGAFLFGMVQFMKWLPNMVQGMQLIEHGEDKTAEPAGASG